MEVLVNEPYEKDGERPIHAQDLPLTEVGALQQRLGWGLLSECRRWLIVGVPSVGWLLRIASPVVVGRGGSSLLF